MYLQICKLVSYGSLVLITCIFNPAVIILENQVESFEDESQIASGKNTNDPKKNEYLDLSQTAIESDFLCYTVR